VGSESVSSSRLANGAAELFAGPGEVRALARDLDWAATPLGTPDTWSPALRSAALWIFDTPVPVCLWSGPEYALVYNDAYRRILAAKHPTSLGQPGSVAWAEIWEQLKPQFDQVRDGGAPSYFEDAPFVMARLEGGGTENAWFSYSLSALRDEDETFAAVLNISPETTARVLADAALKQSQAAARVDAQRVQLALAAGAIVGTWFWDIPADQFTADEPFARAFGLDPVRCREGIPLADIFATVHPDDQAGLAGAIEAATVRGGPYSHQYRVRRADERYYWIEANGRVDHGPTGEPLSFPGVLIDVEERRAVEADRDRATAELRTLNETLEQRVAERTAELMLAEEALRQAQKMEAVGQLTGGIAHDFNNLLMGIGGSLEMLERRLAKQGVDGVERYLHGAQSSTRRAASLTQRLLAFSRRQTLDPKPTDINRLIYGLEDLLRRTVGPSVEVEVVGQGGLWPARIDAAQLESALINLAINARDAMPGGGRITIETGNKWFDDRGARERELSPGQYLSICVTDTGTGIEKEVVDKIFDPFFTTKPIGEGTGLGLSMVHGFVRQSGGQVRVYSEIGQGTTMCLYLPRYLGDVPAEESEDAATADLGTGETILIVDDEPTVRMLMADILSEAGFNILEAQDGPSGLRLLESNARIDLLITDVGLPGGMNGRQVADAARSSRPDLKILFVTGFAENAAVGNGHLPPGMEVLTKPFQVVELANKVSEILG